jgi:PelA/Pel-15E family pectate lyase
MQMTTRGVRVRPVAVLAALGAVLGAGAAAAQAPDRASVEAGLLKAARFFAGLATEGGYAWRYSADLTAREGEARIDGPTIWVQPPGTPTVGEAFLEAHAATGEKFYLDAAVAAARALVRGQLQSGGWGYHVEFDPQKRLRYAYRVDKRKAKENLSTLDDDTTQAALRFLMRTDRALGFKDAAIHEAVTFGLDTLLKRQAPSGGWAVNFPRFEDMATYPVKAASYPETWSRTWTKDFLGCYVLNDNTLADIIETLLLAEEVYKDPRYLAAAKKGGDFILLAQMPEPQPAWAQQYDRDMHPAWSRKFEPPAVCTSESHGIIQVLLTLYRRTRDAKYLKPIPPALAWLRRSVLPDGRLARFYELRTNKPLFFTKDYQLTYDGGNVPTHYGFHIPAKADALEAAYRKAQQPAPPAGPEKRAGKLAQQAAAALAALDGRGAWVEPGKLKSGSGPGGVIQSATFDQNVRLLCRFLRGE